MINKINTKLNLFLKNNDFFDINISELTSSLICDMNFGLSENKSNDSKFDQPMIVASSSFPSNLDKNTKIIVIDAGGTNFRSCLVSVLPSGEYQISNLIKTKMPATDRELSKQEFYDEIAKNLDHLKNQSTKIAFCFSYAMEITPEQDGKILFFSKEIKSPQSIGTYVGQELKQALLNRGWEKIEKITLLNDTMACLLAGFVNSQQKNTKYGSYIGFILGTGINNAYIETNNITKLNNQNKDSKHIVVCECGMFSKLKQSTFDKLVDQNSTNPNSSLLEKQCSGAYLGNIAFYAIKQACSQNLFSKTFSNNFSQINDISPFDIDCYLKNPWNKSTKLGSLLLKCTITDIKFLTLLLKKIIFRASGIVTSVLCASILKTNKGFNRKEPVCIVANGTTFWKTHNLYKITKKLLKKNLAGQNKRFYNIVKIENDVSLGTFAAAFI